MKLFKLTAVLLFVAQSHAASLNSGDARTLINAFKTVGIQGVVSGPDGDKTVTYAFDLQCERSQDLAADPKTVAYGLDTYSCNVGAGKVFLAKAKVLFDTMVGMHGQTGKVTADQTVSIDGLVCTIKTQDTNLDTRFNCTHD